ncbi:phosphoglycerate mutase (2,3-diphosphoglycerate-independent) [Candidatus Roizmanbacteria bacterium RIFCSPHIGHO2_02_FULL_40_13b]|uniref:2,3-bisphosphoglycerate-independent phosphoglycerate mutase n=1 Tax=Candidatus Roizmanbacteria bacterium RIFCSPHIGHO2_01_FULL_39_24 TaxID=1802032 RepID=A0A1F7GEZ6_9BACT|nr:MAG: phosphoglycerate mutase (2,3-diphosphoglycerate-independent) [Candidatus Roizmanbacteria bacterium RIFCSPHIGHO2_01_FULL_39_24]OGK26736.1 MAG: phosphoglycerate mutase (2,3-diphosphoglycerate-independent) [Candidatus Roizmanbacteria bacterium RIFCSPHIGHO2_02_FULL_40_13b]OGK48962.1 MAG: phosphoglycerate mutase (2,3-diphosphoglycerate-independent) [Candidatus Roizmanbacteria bacterium RIFCSPLOWO2_01_FULL_40_32]OGK56769.1 MAG: phosphoglycerate mutase (2,3-diphosphoglycerate-independent) [Cand
MSSVLLIVLDGFGVAGPGPGNPISLSKIPSINGFLRMYPTTQLKASGESVGLPANEVGNTEVGHLNMGAGKVIYQSLPRINLSIGDGSFYKNEVLLEGIDHAKKQGGNLHLLGLIGAGTVHASTEHLFTLLSLCKQQNIKNIFIHAITDGRDSPPQSASEFLKTVDAKCNEFGVGKIASVMGRYYAMDRDKRWERVEKAYKCLTEGVGNKAATWEEVIKKSYDTKVTDEFILPTNIVQNNDPITLIKSGDTVIFYNYRIDRPRELTRAFTLDDFARDANMVSYDPYATKYFKKHLNENEIVMQPPFDRGEKVKDLLFITMTEYEKDLPVKIAFPPHVVPMPLGRVLSEHQMSQLRVTESEKERFVTFYFNGLRENAFPMEDHLIIPSPKVPTYNQKPEMSAPEMTDTLIKKVLENKYKFILCNFANTDMVGHTGDIKACIKAVETVDICLAKVIESALKMEYTVLITADHGNVEEKLDAKGGISTEHTDNPVPFIAISNKLKGKPIRLQTGILADIAPTILKLMGISIPQDMTGKNLLEDIDF